MRNLKEKLKAPDIAYWPEVRWWLAEGFHTDETLKKEVRSIYDAGFGAAEFLAMDEAGADSARYGWGSEEWVHDSQLIVEEATGKRMGVSLTSGTNWSNANLITITPDDKSASKELDFTVETLAPGESRRGPLKKPELSQPNIHQQEFIAAVAARRAGAKGESILLDTASIKLLSEKVTDDGAVFSLDFTAPADGTYELFTFWLHGTGQTATPSAKISYTVNYMDPYGSQALIDYWNREVLTPELKEAIQKNGRAQMYMDSLELSTYGKGNQFWGYHLLEEFKKRRGYDFTPYLPFAMKKGELFPLMHHYYYEPPEGDEFVRKARNDLYQTMTDLYMDNMLRPLQEWLHGIGMTLRAEISYGMPFEISQPGKYVDGIETESLEFLSQIDSHRGLAGPAHLYHRIFSSETGATALNYMKGLRFYTQIIYTQFASGVSRTVLHGYSSIAGAKGTDWPGHEGMWPVFSERFGCRQPAFRHYNDWTAMLSRYQMLLRQGAPRMDLGILRLDYFYNNQLAISAAETGPDEDVIYETRYLRANKGIYWQDMTLQNMGYTYDYFAPQILEEADILYENGMIDPAGPGYRALILYQAELPLNSARRILSWAKRGLPVVIVNGATEMTHLDFYETYPEAAVRTPFNDGKDAELKAVINELKALKNVAEIHDPAKTAEALAALGVAPRARFVRPNHNILTFMRQDGEDKYLFIYNYMYTDREPYTFGISMEGTGTPYKVDCWNGKLEELALYRAGDGHTALELTLYPGEAAMLLLKGGEQEKLHAVKSDAPAVVLRDGKLMVAGSKSGVYTTVLSDGREYKTKLSAREEISLDTWDLTVEDWNKGEEVILHEDRGLGYVTDEIYYETRRTPIHVGKTTLKPWREIGGVGPDVSGVGFYTASVRLPDDWGSSGGARLCLGSTNGNSAAVYVNGEKAPPVDFDHPEVEVGPLLRPGENTIRVEVSSTLCNRLRERGYYDQIPTLRSMNAEEKETVSAQVQDYGLTGRAALIFYSMEPICPERG